MWKLLVLTVVITALVQDATPENISRSRRASRKPSITSTNDEFTVVEGEDVTLPCKVENLGRSYVIWKKDETDIIKIKKMGRQWKIHPPHSSLYKKNFDTGDMSLEETSLTLHSIDADDEGKYLCTIENEDMQVEHTVKIIENEDDYYDYDYYENYEDLFGTEDEDEPSKKDKNGNEASVSSTDVEEEIKEVQNNKFNIDEGTNRDQSIPKNENTKSSPNEYESEDDYYDYYEDIIEVSTTETPTMAPTPEPTKPARTRSWSFWGSGPKKEVTTTTTTETPTTETNEHESDDDYYDYYEDIFENTNEDKTQVEDTEEVETTILPQTEEVSTTETSTMAPKPEPTKPARTWSWSFWGSGPKTEVTTSTTETPTTAHQHLNSYDDYDYEYEEDKKDIVIGTIVDGKYYKEDEQENMINNKQEYDEKDDDSYGHEEEKNTILEGSISQVSVGKNGMACLACTLPLPDGDAQQVHVEWRHNNETITPDGESIVALRDGDMNSLMITSVVREDLGEYRCIVGEDEAVINLVAFPPKPVYKMVDQTSDDNYQITWEAKGLVSLDSYSITYRERDSPLKWWQQEGPFEVSEPSSVDSYSHTFRNLQPYTDYEAIVSTIYQGMATTGDPFPFSVKRTGDMYPSSRKPGNGLVRAWMKQPVAASKDKALELVCTMDTKRRTKFLKMRYPVSVDYTFEDHPDIPVIMEPIEVQWFHGKNPETPVEDKDRITSYQKGKNNILRFTSVEPSDLGEYRCQGQTPTGIKEATVQLVAFPPPANKQEITELDSGIYKLKWESKGLAPVTSFSITYRKTDSTSEGWNQIGPILINDEENTDDTHSYVFTNLQPSSSYDVIISTIYRDLATTGEPFSFTTKDDPLQPVGNRHQYSSAPSEQAPISYPSMNDMGQVNVWMEHPVVHVDIGASSQLVCVVDEQQDIQVEWYHGRQRVNTDNTRSINKENNRSILKFMSVSSLDLGTYQCSASNKFGRAAAFARLTTIDDADSLVPPKGVLRSEDVTQWWSLTQSIFSDVHKYLKTLTRIPQPTEFDV